MASQTPNLNLYKVNPETDGEMTFNVKTMLNENWDRLDESIGEVHQEITTHRADYVRHPGYAVTAGTGNAYTVTTDPAPTAYVDGMGIVIRANRANTGAATLNWNGLGAMPIVDAKGNALIAGKIPNGARLSLRYSSAAGNFQLQGEGGEYGTATPADVLAGKTIGTEGGLVTGTMQDRGNVTATLTNQGQQYTIPVGKHGGSGIITANITNLNAANIKSGVSVGGVAGAFTSDATATAAQILTGQTAYTSGTKLTGTMPNRGAVSNTITTQGGQYTIPAGYHSGSGKVTASFTNLIAANVKKGVNIGGIVGTFSSFAPEIVIPLYNRGVFYCDYNSSGVILNSDHLEFPRNTGCDIRFNIDCNKYSSKIIFVNMNLDAYSAIDVGFQSSNGATNYTTFERWAPGVIADWTNLVRLSYRTVMNNYYPYIRHWNDYPRVRVYDIFVFYTSTNINGIRDID